MTGTQRGHAAINGANIYYETAGQGFPLVMTHAGIADCRMWDDQFSFFADRYRVVRWDMRGFGQSAPVDGEYSRHGDLRDLLKFLGVERAYLMGCSMGGQASLNFALEYPDMAAALITVGSGPDGLEADAKPPKQWEEIVKSFKEGNLERTSELETEVWVDGRGRSPDQVNPAVRKKVYEMNLIALRNEVQGAGKALPLDPPAATRLGELKLPMLVVAGDLDDEFILFAADHMEKNIPTAKKVIMTGTAHVPNMEFPDVFNGYVAAFLDGLK